MSFISTKINFQSIACFICIYLIVFGPKIGGYFDLSVLTSSFLLLYLFKRAKIYKYAITSFCLLWTIITYSLIVSIFSGENLDIVFLLKFIRVLLALLCISNYIELNIFSTGHIKNTLVNVLLLHAFVIIVSSIFFVDLQFFLSPLSGFHKTARFFRSTGLTNGFDFAGLLCVIGLLITYLEKKESFKTFKSLVFIVASFLTSRMNMILVECIIIYIIFFQSDFNKIRKILLCIIFICTLIPVVGIFSFTTNNQNNIIAASLLKNQKIAEISSRLVNYYATSDISNTIHSQYNFSKLNNADFIWGAMQDAHQDPSYTQYIYKIGVLGTAIAVLFYLFITTHALVLKKQNKNNSLIVVFISLFCLIFSVKNSYLLARHVTETLLIIYTLLCKESNSQVQQIKLGKF